MHHASSRHLSRQRAACAGALLIGTDAPSLDVPALRAAARAPAGHDAVFVPALDGGCALADLTRPQPALFADRPWSTRGVIAETRIRARRDGLRWADLPPVADIDETADLVHLPAAWRRRPRTHGRSNG